MYMQSCGKNITVDGPTSIQLLQFSNDSMKLLGEIKWGVNSFHTSTTLSHYLLSNAIMAHGMIDCFQTNRLDTEMGLSSICWRESSGHIWRRQLSYLGYAMPDTQRHPENRACIQMFHVCSIQRCNMHQKSPIQLSSKWWFRVSDKFVPSTSSI